jgi:lipopolysaccharide transport system ATP-binding protein
MSDTVISVESLSKSYLVGHEGPRERYHSLRDSLVRHGKNYVRKAVDMARGRQIIQGDSIEEFWALKDVSFEVRRGEVLGIIGRNGAGKSTLLKILSRITEPTSGRVTLRGRVASLLEVGTGFHPELTGRENIFLNGAILGMRQVEIKKKFEEIVHFAEVEKFLDTPVKRYSSGMYVRLAFAVAAHLESEILIVDEVLAVGDVEFQKKCLGKMQNVASSGRTVLFVSHNMAAIKSLTSRCIFLKQGCVLGQGATNEILNIYVNSSSVDKTTVQKKVWGKGIHSKILSASLLNETGQSISSYNSGEQFNVLVRFETDGIAGLSIELFLTDPNQLPLGLASLHQFDGKTLPSKPGSYEFTFKMKGLYLASGTYSIGISTSVVNSHFDHVVSEAITFEVPFSNPGGGSWDFKYALGYGSIGLLCVEKCNFNEIFCH